MSSKIIINVPLDVDLDVVVVVVVCGVCRRCYDS
jgi:hypothetical protein